MVFQAGSSDAGIGLAGKHADAVFTNSASLEENQTFLKRVKQRVLSRRAGRCRRQDFSRHRAHRRRTQEEAEAKYDVIRNLITIEDGARLSRALL